MFKKSVYPSKRYYYFLNIKTKAMRLKLVESREVLERTSLEIGSKGVLDYPHTRKAINSMIADLTANTINSKDLEVIRYTNGKLEKFSKEDPSIMYSVELKTEGNPITNYLIVTTVKVTCEWKRKVKLSYEEYLKNET